MAISQGLKLGDVFYAIGADISAFTAARRQVERDAADTGKKIDHSITLKGLLQDIQLGRSRMAILGEASGVLERKLKGASVDALNKGLSTAKGLLGDIAKGIAIGAGIGIFQSLSQGVADVVGFLPSLIEKGKQYALLVDSIGDSTGATSQASSRLAATLLYLGAPVGSITNLLGQMSRLLDENEGRLNALGVETKDANGATLDQVQILDNARRAFQRYGDGTAKAKAIALEFGRGGLGTLVDYLHLTDAQFKAITDDAERMGLILPESVRNLGESAQRESNRFQNALTGLGVALFTTVGPEISAFFSGLTTEIETHVTDIQNAVGSAISYIMGLVNGLIGIGDGVDSFSAAIERGNAVTSPYSARIFQLTSQLADLQAASDNAGDSTAAQSRAIRDQMDAIGNEIDALKALEATQQRTADKAIAAIYAEIDAQDQLLAAQDKALSRAREDLSQTRSLADAKRALAEAQAQLRLDALQGKSTDEDTTRIAKAQQDILDAQQAARDTAATRAREDRSAQLQAIKDYIASSTKLLEDADNKRAALNTIRRREAVLEARRTAQLAAGDATGADDTALKLEALKTLETRAAQEVANARKQTALEAQRSELEDRASALQNFAADQRATEIQSTKDTIAELEKRQAAWEASSAAERSAIHGVSDAINGKTGGARRPGGAAAGATSLVAAMDEARDHGVDMGTQIKSALDEVIGGISSVKDAFGHMFDALTDAWNLLPEPLKGVVAGAAAGFVATGGNPLGAAAGALVGGTLQLGGINSANAAQAKQLVTQTTNWANTASLEDLQSTWRALIAERDKQPQRMRNGVTSPGYDLFNQLVEIIGDAIVARFKATPGRAAGGWAGKRGPELSWLGERAPEYVLRDDLAIRLQAFLDHFQAPAPALAGAGAGAPEIHLYLGGRGSREITDWIDEQLSRRRRR